MNHRVAAGSRTLVTLAICALPIVPALAQTQDSTRRASLSSVTFHGLIQTWFRTGDALNDRDTYRIRRAEFGFSGEVSPRARWRLTLDAGKLISLVNNPVKTDTVTRSDVSLDQRGRPLQDASLTFVFNPRLRVDVGQHMLPLTREGNISSGEIETIERGMMTSDRARGGAFGFVRDIGVTLRGEAGRLEYNVGTYNALGDTQNAADPNDQKAVAGRLLFRVPGLDELKVGGSAGLEDGPASAQRRTRAGAEAELRATRLTIRGEAMQGEDGGIRREGFYLLGAYKARSDVQLVGRIDSWDPDRDRETTLASASTMQLVGGVNYFIDTSARLAANVVRTSFPDAGLSSTTALMLSAQILW